MEMYNFKLFLCCGLVKFLLHSLCKLIIYNNSRQNWNMEKNWLNGLQFVSWNRHACMSIECSLVAWRWTPSSLQIDHSTIDSPFVALFLSIDLSLLQWEIPLLTAIYFVLQPWRGPYRHALRADRSLPPCAPLGTTSCRSQMFPQTSKYPL